MPHKQYRILVVDDEPSNRKLLNQILKDNYQLAFAVDGKQAVEIAKQVQPDLILLDIMMPEMDGYQACQKLKSDTQTSKIPVIFTTAMNETEDEIRGFKAGCVDYISKPFSPSIVLARVKTQLKLKESFETMAAQNKKLMEAVRLREEVERITRHDLKNPLTGVFSGVELLEVMEGLNPEQLEILGIIKDSAHEMLNMINASFDLFKMEQNIYRLTLVDVDLIKIVSRIEKEFQSLIKLRQTSILTLKDNLPPGENENFIVKAENLLIYSMMDNLIKNAIEATPENETICITLSKEEKQAIICIHNKGSVPEKIQKTFFDKYVTDGKAKGTGIGTYSARLIVETLGGSIHMTTSEEKGTKISILLPHDGSL
ncbi:MAG: response regulator [Pseudomonadota bacterium]